MFASFAKNIAWVCGIVCVLLMTVLVIGGNFRKPDLIAETDYVAALWVAGHMVNDGKAMDLYPPLQAETFAGQKFQTYARELLPLHESNRLYLYMYPPVVAVALAPLAHFDPLNSLVMFQIKTLFALLISCFLFAAVQGVRASPWKLFFCAAMFLPMLNVFVTGQTSILLGLFPLTVGYFFWQKDRPILAGISWSLMTLKPQIFIPVFLVVAALTVAATFKKALKIEAEIGEPIRILVGLLIGTAVLHLISLVALGFDPFVLWLNSMRISSESFGRQDTGYWQYYLAVSLPCVVLLALPKDLWLAARKPSYLLGIANIFVALWLMLKTMKLPLSKPQVRDVIFVIAIGFMLAIAPYLRIYDAVLFILVGWIVFFKFDATAAGQAARRGTYLGWFAFNAYFVSILIPSLVPGTPMQIAFLVCIIGAYAMFLKSLFAEPSL